MTRFAQDIDYFYTLGTVSGSRSFVYKYRNISESTGGTFARWQEVSSISMIQLRRRTCTHAEVNGWKMLSLSQIRREIVSRSIFSWFELKQLKVWSGINVVFPYESIHKFCFSSNCPPHVLRQGLVLPILFMTGNAKSTSVGHPKLAEASPAGPHLKLHGPKSIQRACSLRFWYI